MRALLITLVLLAGGCTVKEKTDVDRTIYFTAEQTNILHRGATHEMAVETGWLGCDESWLLIVPLEGNPSRQSIKSHSHVALVDCGSDGSLDLVRYRLKRSMVYPYETNHTYEVWKGESFNPRPHSGWQRLFETLLAQHNPK